MKSLKRIITTLTIVLALSSALQAFQTSNWVKFAPAGGGFHLMAPNGDKPVATWVSPTRSAVTICRFLRELTWRGLSIAVRIVARSFSGFAPCAGQLPVSHVAVNTTVENSICGFGLSSVAGIGDSGGIVAT